MNNVANMASGDNYFSALSKHEVLINAAEAVRQHPCQDTDCAKAQRERDAQVIDHIAHAALMEISAFEIANNWPEVVSELPMPARSLAERCKAGVSGFHLILLVDKSFSSMASASTITRLKNQLLRLNENLSICVEVSNEVNA